MQQGIISIRIRVRKKGCSASEGPVRIPIYVFPEIILRGLIISKTEL